MSEEPPRIVIAVGLPGSGKSTWFERQGITPISSDAVRQLLADDPTDQSIHARVFATIRYLLRQRLVIGRPVSYVDATHLVPAERAPYVLIARAFHATIEAVYFDVPAAVCLQRNLARKRNVPPEAIEAMAAKLVPPTLAEGFSRITTINE